MIESYAFVESDMQLKRVAEAKLPTPWGDFLMVGFEELATGHDHLALVFGDISGEAPVLARVHSECLTGDALFSLRCDCGFQLEAALEQIAEEGRGILLYHRRGPQYRPVEQDPRLCPAG